MIAGAFEVCINWTLIIGVAISGLVWWYTIKSAAYEVGVFMITEYGKW